MNSTNHKEQGNPMAKSEIIELMAAMLITYGSLSEEELDYIRLYFTDGKNEEEKREVLQSALLTALRKSRASRSFPFPAEDENVEQGWARLAQTLDLNPDIEHYRDIRSSRTSDGVQNEPVTPAHTPTRRLPLRRVALRVAAVLVPVALIVGGYLWYGRNGSVPQGATYESANFVATNTVKTEPDSVRHITLPDGTEVTLNKNATFAYNDHREGELHGEAFFKVAKDPEHPFVINSDNLTVTVLGTEFNFNTSTEGSSILSLYEGVVELGSAAGTYRLDEAGHEFTLDNATAQADISTFDTAELPEWLEAYETGLEIRSLDEIFDMIETHYGVRIVNRDVIDTSRRFNFTLDRAVTLDSAMYALEYANGHFNYAIDGDIITLSKQQ